MWLLWFKDVKGAAGGDSAGLGGCPVAPSAALCGGRSCASTQLVVLLYPRSLPHPHPREICPEATAPPRWTQ